MTDDLAAFLDGVEARAAAATSGVWHVTHDPLGTHVENGDGRGRIVFASGADRVDGNGEADAAFIAAARFDVRALVTMVRAVLVDCDNLRAENACLRRERDLAMAKVRAEDRIVLGD